MKKDTLERLNYLQEHHFSEYMKERRATEEQLSNKHGMFCVCRRLATGFHEMGCQKFQNQVTESTVGKLAHLVQLKSN